MPDRRRPGHRTVAGAAAAVLLLAGAAYTVGSRDEQAGEAAAPTGTAGWRTEQWHDVQVSVPADWGHGGAPAGEVGAAVTCYPAAAVDAAGAAVDAAQATDLPYVGRPVALTDVCVPYPDNRPDAPATDYVWLGAAVAPGVVELGNGLVQETVRQAGTTVTVATTDSALRAQVLDSVTGGERCLAEVDVTGRVGHDEARDLGADPVTLRVCAYRLDDGARDPWRLAYAADLGATALAAYVEAVGTGRPAVDQCPTRDRRPTEAVVLELLDADGGVLRQDAVDSSASCAGVAVDATRVWEPETVALTPAMTRPWAVGGVPAVVQGDPALGFVGPQG